MKQFLFRIALLLVIVLAVLTLVLFAIPNNKIPDNSLFASHDKHQRLESLSSPKIVLVGGSNLPFGIKSEMIEEAMGLPVVNMGLHAGLGMNFILSEVEEDIHKGDVVVVSLEYHHFLSSTMYNGEDVLAALLFDVNRNCISCVKFGQWMAMIPNICLYASKKLINISSPKVDDFEDLFTRESFNEYGDEVAHYGLASTVHSGDKPELSKSVYKKSIKRLVEFCDFVESKGATFVLVACPYPESQYILDEEAIGHIEEELLSAGLSFSIKPQDCVFPDSLMFNSFFHLSGFGAKVRTKKLIDVLNKERI